MKHKPKKDDGATKNPAVIILVEAVAWSENECLRRFEENQIVLDPRDIEALIKRDALYEVIRE